MLYRALPVLGLVFVLVLVLLTAACAGPSFRIVQSPVVGPSVDRIDASAVRIRWPATFSKTSVKIFTGVDPDEIDHAAPIAVSNQRSIKLTERQDFEINERRRLYFELVPTVGGRPVVVAERRLPLSCCDNFRDLGGYKTANGRSVRWNRLYRSDELSSLAGRDLEYLSQLEIKLVCDFRSDRERTADPDRKIDPTAEGLALPVNQQGVDPEEIQRKIRTGGMVALGVEQTMVDAYRAFVTDYSDVWAAMFERLSRPENYPTVVHCTAGKDRTGFASALVLLAVGVPVETVFRDYLLTNYYRQNFMRFVLRWAPLYSFFRTEQKDLLPLLLAKRKYLQASLDAMIEHHGSIDGYLEGALGLTPQRRAQLGALLLRGSSP